MNIRHLTTTEFEQAFSTHLRLCFPHDELSSLAELLHLHENGDLFVLGAFAGEVLLGISVVEHHEEWGGSPSWLAILPPFRSLGVGSELYKASLEESKDRYSHTAFLLEIEDPPLTTSTVTSMEIL